MNILKKVVVATGIAGMAIGTTLTTDQARAADVGPGGIGGFTNSTAIWAGIGLLEDSFAAHAGGVWAANGDLDATGWMVRAQGIYVDFEFDTAATASGEADGELARANASLGYQWASPGMLASFFAGIDVQDVDYSPSAAGGNLDDEVGLILTGRLATDHSAVYPMSLEANYSTANDSYWARGRVGYRFSSFDLGPEVAVLGSDGYDAFRIGGYAKTGLGSAILELNAGYHDGDGTGGGSGGDDSVYGGATIIFVF